MSLESASNNIKAAIPAEIALQDDYKMSGVVSRADTFQQAEQNAYNPGQQIYVYLPLQCSDLRESTLQFRINGTAYGAPATFTRFEQGISCIFSRLEVLFGSTNVVDIINPDILKSIIRYNSPVNYSEGIGNVLEGTSATGATRNADFLNANRVYAVSFKGLGLFDKILPLNKLNVQMRIRLTLRQPEECLVTDNIGGTAGTYQVVNPEFHYSTLIMSQQWNNLYDKLVAERNGINYTFKTWANFQSTNLLTAGVTNAQAVLPFRYSSVLGISYVQRVLANLTDATFEGKNNVFLFNDFNTSRLKINSVYYPLDQVRSGQDLLSQHLDCYDLGYHSDVLIANNFLTTSCVNSTPLMAHPKDKRDINGSICGINTSSSGTSIIAEIRFNTPLPAVNQLDYFVSYEAVVRFNSNGSISYYQ